ncbi:hypothetical protein OIU79_000631 [Salix purpurea]|uniref:Uncharacterized protein n=1 Tax=Salix purpurea TaxID=77065 RepID=A0A9Q0V2J0_SALPP|nr:hypothetical protein OIU79_000631 [Salix purpurea]
MLLRLSCKRFTSRSVCSFIPFSCSTLIFSISDALAAAAVLVATPPFDEAMVVFVALYVFLVCSRFVNRSLSYLLLCAVVWGLTI